MRTLITVPLLALLLAGCGGGGASAAGSQASVADITEQPTFTTWTPETHTPAPSEFAVGITVLKKECFGEAGCNVTYRIRPGYTGPTLDSSQSFTVTYTVLGGDQEQQGSFTITGEQANFSGEEMIQTKTSKARLTIRVDEVLPT